MSTYAELAYRYLTHPDGNGPGVYVALNPNTAA